MMSDSSDDEPIALKRRKVEHTNGKDGTDGLKSMMMVVFTAINAKPINIDVLCRH